MTIKNVTYGFIVGTFLIISMVGFLSPVIWPELYKHHYYPIYGFTPLVQHHVEFCDMEFFLEQTTCSENQIFIT